MIRRLVNGLGKHKLELVCSDCGKPFNTKENSIWYTQQPSGDFSVYCDKCVESWRKGYQLKSINFANGLVAGEFANGSKFGPVNESTFLFNGNFPEETYQQFTREKEKHFAEQKKVQIDTFDMVDNFDTQEIRCSTFGGDSYKIPFKYGKNGAIMLDPKVKLTDNIKEQINERLRMM